jgi:sterol desaturase/sphingolipid hydroxylase (fatty acid hydroxylase superfamily)
MTGDSELSPELHSATRSAKGKGSGAAGTTKPFYRMSQAEADILWWATPVLCIASGVMFRPDPVVWYQVFTALTVILVPGWFVAGAAFDWLAHQLAAPRAGARLQSSKTEPPMYVRESLETALCMLIVATICAWPVSLWASGQPTAFRATLEEASIGTGVVAHGFYLLKVVGCLFFADLWTFWKHFALHHPCLYAVHKSHHMHHNPSAYASFAVHPVEAVLTFLPVLIMCDGSGFVNLWIFYHFPFMFGLGILNLYLHAGVNIPALEAVLVPLCINSSVYHNNHHNLQVTHFAEVLTIWDYILGTHTGAWSQKKLDSVSDAIRTGGGKQTSLSHF